MPECEYVGNSAFYDNTNFTSLTLADGCVIGDNAFALSSGQSNETLNNAYIRPSSIGRLAFGRRIIPYGIDFSLCTYIATGAFNGLCDYGDGQVPVRILPQGLDFSYDRKNRFKDISNYESDYILQLIDESDVYNWELEYVDEYGEGSTSTSLDDFKENMIYDFPELDDVEFITWSYNNYACSIGIPITATTVKNFKKYKEYTKNWFTIDEEAE